MFGIADYAAFCAAIVVFLAIPGPGNLALITSTSYALSQVTLETDVRVITLLGTARGFAMGFMMMPVQTAAYNTVPQAKIARATALSNGLMQIGRAHV